VASPKTGFVVLVALVVFGGGLGLSWVQDSRRAGRSASRTASQLASLLAAEDDLMLVDWARSLEASEDVVALRLVLHGNERFAFGDPSLLRETSSPTFLFPCTWVTKPVVTENPGDALLIVAERIVPGPFAWGLFTLLAASIFRWFPSGNRPIGTGKDLPPIDLAAAETGFSGPAPPGDGNLSAVLHHVAGQDAWIGLDRRYRVLWMSARVSVLLGREPGPEGSFHLLDLGPADSLIDALESGEPSEVEYPFKNGGVRRATVEMASFGRLLRLYR